MGVKTVRRSATERSKMRSQGRMPKKTRDNNSTQVTATVKNYHPFGSPQDSCRAHKHAQEHRQSEER